MCLVYVKQTGQANPTATGIMPATSSTHDHTRFWMEIKLGKMELTKHINISIKYT